jgi:hypothetical protein
MIDEQQYRDTSGEELTRGTLGAQQSIRMNLSARQLHDHENDPSWKAPHDPPHRRWSTTRIVTLAVLLATLAVVICLKVAGVV